MNIDIRSSLQWSKNMISAKLYKNLAWWGWHMNGKDEISVEHYCRPDSSFMWSAVDEKTAACVRCGHELEDKLKGLEAQYIAATYCRCLDPHEHGNVKSEGRVYSYDKSDYVYIVRHSDDSSGTHTTAILDINRAPLLKVEDEYCYICKDFVATTENLEFIILKTRLGVKPHGQ